MRAAAFLLAVALALLTPPAAARDMAQARPVVRVLTNGFVLPAKFRGLGPLATEAGIALDAVDIESGWP